MTKDELIAKRDEVSKRYTQMEAEAQAELNRLQGDYRTLTAFIDGLENKPEKKKE